MTEAGKRLLARLSLDVPWFIAGNKDIEEQMVLAIEAEAVAAERARALPVIEAARALVEHHPPRDPALATFRAALAAWEEGK